MQVEDLSSHANRALQAALPPLYYPADVARWAIVVGISKYKDESINLKYADRDAEALYKLLLTPSGGGFEKEHIELLTNEKATTANITRALRSFLKKPAKEDIVLIYFACHGAPDIERPDILYLLTHDTDRSDIAGTALPMREINLSLQGTLSAERIILIADTCHSAGINKPGVRDASDNSGAINLYLKEVEKAKKGVAVLTSAEANQDSREGENWGGGHGVFTHYLLEGMQGAADNNPRDGIVTVGELFEYVRENVIKDTKDQQHPCIGTNAFDRDLPIAITAEISTYEHQELGYQLYQLGLRLDDKSCFESSSRHLGNALFFSSTTQSNHPEIHLQLGLTWMATGDLVRAIQEFEEAAKENVPDAAYYLGIVYLKQNEPDQAMSAFKSFLTQQPDDDKVAWVKKLVAWLQPESSKLHALLIGINYSDQKIKLREGGAILPSLRGCVNDIQILNDVLSKKYNFNVKMLPNVEATYENILKAFHNLQRQAKLNDIVVIHFSGHEILGSLAAFDVQLNAQEDIINTLSIKEFYGLVTSITGAHKIIFVDTVISTPFEELIRLFRQSKNCTLFLAASPGQNSYEQNIDHCLYGFFSYTLAQELWQASEAAKQTDIFSKVRELVQAKFPQQQPFLVDNLNGKLFPKRLDYCPDTFDLSWYHNYSVLPLESLSLRYKNVVEKLGVPFSPLHFNVGRAFLERHDSQQALKALETALQQSKDNDATILFELGIAQFQQRLYAAASSTFQHCKTATCLAANSNQLQELIDQINALQQPQSSTRYALLVGIKDYLNGDVKAAKGAINDVLLLKKVLIDKCGFQAENIKIILDKNATCQAILNGFKELANKSYESPALFYFAGNGSWNYNNLTILGVDSRKAEIFDIELNELAEIVGNRSTNLVTIIDASWAIMEGSEDYCHRVVPPDERSLPSKRHMIPGKPPRECTAQFLSSNSLKIGCVSIYSHSIRQEVYERGSLEVEVTYAEDGAEKLIYDPLTYNLVESLRRSEIGTWNYNQLVESMPSEAQPFIVGNDLDEHLFENFVDRNSVNELLRKIKQEPVKETIKLLKRLIEQRKVFPPESYLNLGIAYYVLSDYDNSISSLETALIQVSDQSSEQRRAGSAFPEARYWLGRVLCESKRDPAYAVKELRLATQQDSSNATAHYYLGQALRAMVEQEILVEAEKAFQTYLEAGSPLGQESEVQEFLRSRRDAQSIQG